MSPVFLNWRGNKYKHFSIVATFVSRFFTFGGKTNVKGRNLQFLFCPFQLLLLEQFSIEKPQIVYCGNRFFYKKRLPLQPFSCKCGYFTKFPMKNSPQLPVVSHEDERIPVWRVEPSPSDLSSPAVYAAVLVTSVWITVSPQARNVSPCAFVRCSRAWITLHVAVYNE